MHLSIPQDEVSRRFIGWSFGVGTFSRASCKEPDGLKEGIQSMNLALSVQAILQSKQQLH